MASVTTEEQLIVRLTADNKALKAKLKESQNVANRTSSGIERSFAKLFAGISLALVTKTVVSYGDTWSSVNARLKLVSETTREFTTVQTELYNIAQRSRTTFVGTTDLYTKLARSTDALGISTKELLGVTETITKALTISGATTTEANSALLQLSQGMASGTLRGEELNSVMENTPRLARAIADGMGISIGQLRSLGSEGKLTAETVIKALKSQSDTIQKEFTQIPQTVGQSFVKLKNAMLRAVGNIGTALGSQQGLVRAVDFVTAAIENSKDAVLIFSATAVSILGRTTLLFKALGGTIYDTMAGIKGGSEDTNKLWEAFLGYDIVEQATIQLKSFNEAIENSKNVMQGSLGPLATYDAALASLQQRLDPIGTAFKQTQSDIKQLTDYYNSGKISLEQYNEMLYQTSKNYADAANKASMFKDKVSDSDKALKAVSGILSSGVTNAFRQAMDGATNFGSAFKSIAKDIIAQLIHIMFVQRAVNALLGVVGGGASAATSVSPSAGVAVAGAAASGGLIRQGGSYLVGENGPEIVTLPGNANVIPNGGSTNTGVTVNVINNTNSSVNVQEEDGKIDIIIDAIAASITRGTGSVGPAIETRYGLSKA